MPGAGQGAAPGGFGVRTGGEERAEGSWGAGGGRRRMLSSPRSGQGGAVVLAARIWPRVLKQEVTGSQ